jgi:hypothetical protein
MEISSHFNNMYGTSAHTADSLSDEISIANIITADTLSRAATSFHHQLQMVMDVYSSHIKHVFYCSQVYHARY